MSKDGTDFGKVSADDPGLFTCVSCDRRDRLEWRGPPWHMSGEHAAIRVGCSRCDLWFSGRHHWHAVARWNWRAVQELRAKGKEVRHAHFFGMLHEEAEHEEAMEVLRENRKQYLNENLLQEWPLQVGDLFVMPSHRAGTFEVYDIEAAWDLSKGPLWIARASLLSPGGLRGREEVAVWPDDLPLVRHVERFWTPWRWSHIVPGDDCRVDGKKAKVVALNRRGRRITVRVDGRKEIHLRRLDQLHVPLERVRSRPQ